MKIFDTVIDGYSRAQALQDGALIAAPAELAANAGFRCPVALTRAAWADCVAWTDDDTDRTGALQDQDGRLWDVLWMAARANHTTQDRRHATFTVHRIPRDVTTEDLADDDYEIPAVRLFVSIDPGDDFETVVTIHQPGEH